MVNTAHEVVEAVTLLGDEDDAAFQDGGVSYLGVGVGADLLCHFYPAFFKFVVAHVDGAGKNSLTSVEPAGDRVCMVGSFQNPAAYVREKLGDFGDDADAVGAVQGKNVAVFIAGHGGLLVVHNHVPYFSG